MSRRIARCLGLLVTKSVSSQTFSFQRLSFLLLPFVFPLSIAHDASKCVVGKTVEGGASKEAFCLRGHNFFCGELLRFSPRHSEISFEALAEAKCAGLALSVSAAPAESVTFPLSSFFERPKKEEKKSSAHDDFATTLISCISRDPSRSGCLAFCKAHGFFRAGTSGSLTMPIAHDASKCVVGKTVEGGASEEDFSNGES
jgi:hypothetical protein